MHMPLQQQFVYVKEQDLVKSISNIMSSIGSSNFSFSIPSYLHGRLYILINKSWKRKAIKIMTLTRIFIRLQLGPVEHAMQPKPHTMLEWV